MQITYFDRTDISEKAVSTGVKALADYRGEIDTVVNESDYARPESCLATWQDEATLNEVTTVAARLGKVKHVVVIGIGGSSLGIEAVHQVLGDGRVQLHVLDTIAPYQLQAVLESLRKIKKAEQIAICAISKSGGTTETLANTAVLLEALEHQLGKKIHKQVIYIGNPGNDLLKTGQKLGGQTVAMSETIGGRYSIFTPVGLVPMLLLGYDVEAVLSGAADATDEMFEEAVAESAARLHLYLKKGVRHVNFFAFDTRLQKLGEWYRQLAAESLGKEHDLDKKPVKLGFVPTISTPVELHSTGQLYLSGFTGVYTDFVTFDDEKIDYEISAKSKIAPKLKRKSHQEIASAIYGGVIGAYQERELPYRATLFEDDLAYSIGLFMGMRMLETMYVAKLMNVNAFDQPNVELYKDKTRKILGV